MGEHTRYPNTRETEAEGLEFKVTKEFEAIVGYSFKKQNKTDLKSSILGLGI